jgi:macrodomain Ter protein organizer (MatP/YcbG family)
MTRLENLKADLAAIDRLNRFYWQTEEPDRYEKLAYLVRKHRRRELITELLKLIEAQSRLGSILGNPALPF